MPYIDGIHVYSPCKRVRINGKKRRVSHLVIERTGHILKKNEVVHHIDGNTQNNKLSNLSIMSRSDHTKLHNPRDYLKYNISAAADKKLWSKCYNHEKYKNVSKIKITPKIYTEIKKLLNLGIKQIEIAKMFQIHPSAISNIKRGTRYKSGYGWILSELDIKRIIK